MKKTYFVRFSGNTDIDAENFDDAINQFWEMSYEIANYIHIDECRSYDEEDEKNEKSL